MNSVIWIQTVPHNFKNWTQKRANIAVAALLTGGSSSLQLYPNARFLIWTPPDNISFRMTSICFKLMDSHLDRPVVSSAQRWHLGPAQNIRSLQGHLHRPPPPPRPPLSVRLRPLRTVLRQFPSDMMSPYMSLAAEAEDLFNLLQNRNANVAAPLPRGTRWIYRPRH